jgi:hypothetical protein
MNRTLESPAPTLAREGWFQSGVFLVTLATLALEMLDTRLLSVVTLYHLSFFAISMAMFGMAAGAVHVYLAGHRFSGRTVPAALARFTLRFALTIPAAHMVALIVPLPFAPSVAAVGGIIVTSLALALPFFLSGVVVAIALTRIAARIGRTYATDLVGAALGCLIVIPLLRYADISSATLVVAALAALAAACFARFASDRGTTFATVVALLLATAGYLNTLNPHGLRVIYQKGVYRPPSDVAFEAWNSYSQITAMNPRLGPPFYWAATPAPQEKPLRSVNIRVDGLAGTEATEWDGTIESLDWVRRDVTSLPYHLRKQGNVAIIGVGGGRDVLTALWARSRSVVGIEVNDNVIRLLSGPLRKFTAIVDRPDVRIVNDEARSHLTRTSERFDVLQMSLVDTWAATGAGAFTLSENALYTLESWKVFLETLKPDGIFSVSRWFFPARLSETSRVAALAMAALFDRGVTDPGRHVALVYQTSHVGIVAPETLLWAAEREDFNVGVATLLVSPSPLSAADLDALDAAARGEGLRVLFSPRRPASDRLLSAIFAARSRAELDAVLDAEPYNYSPPTDARPYFFNMLRPTTFLRTDIVKTAGLSAWGNLFAGIALALLIGISGALVGAMLAVPLLRVGRPVLPPRVFPAAIAYFALIGTGFMMVQIPYVQRFSVYLGHPTYAIAVILFSMILFAGIGSFVSDQLYIGPRSQWLVAVPWAAAALLSLVCAIMQLLIDATVRLDLLARCAIAVTATATPSFFLGFCFPIGMRLLRPFGDAVMPWMWGVNGACGVLASVAAVAISVVWGIDASLAIAVACYVALPAPARVLASRGASNEEVRMSDDAESDDARPQRQAAVSDAEI